MLKFLAKLLNYLLFTFFAYRLNLMKKEYKHYCGFFEKTCYYNAKTVFNP